MSINYERVESGSLFKWDVPGKTVEGVLANYESKKTPKGDGHVYEVRTKDGIVPFFAPSLLHKKLRNIALGNGVKIVYEKQEKTMSGNEAKIFTVDTFPATAENLKEIGMVPESTDPDATTSTPKYHAADASDVEM